MTLEEFAKLSPSERLDFADVHDGWLQDLNESELDEVGRLLCHSSHLYARQRSPILGDSPYRDSEDQEAFEETVFGNLDKNDRAVPQEQIKRGDFPHE